MIRFLILTVVVCLAHMVAMAQTSINTSQYWSLLSETNTLLQSGSGNIPEQIAALWQGVESVQLEDGQVIRIDTDWLFDTDLDRLQQRVEAALAANDGFRMESSAASLTDLEQILQDERFRYQTDPANQQTEEQSEPTSDSTDESNLPLSLSQIILTIVGVIVAIFLITSINRNLRLQRYYQAPSDQEDDPTTSEDAQARAANSEIERDYRAAIRYLYLSSLLLLDERGIIHYDPSQTNVEHLRQLQAQPQLHDLLRRIVDTFDHVWYGFYPVDEKGYMQFQQHIQRLKGLTAL